MPAQPPPAYIHTLTSAFASTLDEIPQDMCRHFADLRELDAVLSQSLSGITKRIEQLTDRIEGGLASLESLNANAVPATDANAADREAAKEEEVAGMFQLLHEIADDTSRIKLGGEDKIRVASLAVEHMNAYHSHLLTVVRRMYDMDAAYNVEILAPFTTYPHVPPAALIDPAPENRRGAPRRTVAVQNNSYGIPYASASNATQQNRTDSTQRGVNGTNDSPNKRRRLQGQSTSHHGQRIEMVDTDENSTPRRGPAALDAEAYRPGGNTANRPKAQGRKIREGRAVSQHQGPAEVGSNPLVDGMAISRGESAYHLSTMQGIEPTAHTQMPAPSHKSTTQNGRGRSNASHHQPPPPNPNPQPQAYPMSYAGYNGSARSRNPYDATSTNYEVSAYTPQANVNPVMDATYHQGQPMNMNPNLNQMSSNSTYPHSGMGMLIPAHLPPPPGSGHGRPSSGSVSRQNVYDVPPPASSSVSRADPTPASAPMQGYSTSAKGSSRNMDSAPKDRMVDMGRENGPSASANGGLMPLPMMTSLPPVTTFTQSTSLSMGHSVSASESGHGRSRGYSRSGYGNNGYSAIDNPNTSSMSASYGPHQTVYQQPPPSSPLGHSTSASYGGSGTMEKGRSDVHPSLVNNSAKELPPISTHVRDPSIPAVGSAGSAGSGSGTMHASLAREPPFRTNSAGSGDRSERDPKSAVSGPRSGTASGGNPTPSYPGAGGKYRDEVDRDLNSVPATERDRDNHNTGSGYSSRHPSLHSVAPPGVGQTHPSLHPSIQTNARYVYGKDEPFVVKDERNPEYIKRQPLIDRVTDDREKEQTRDARVVEYNNRDMKGDGDVTMMDVDEKTRAPIRRKNVDELRSSSPYAIAGSGGNDGGGVEGQVLDEDSKPYCVCGQPSFGQMLACDDLECEFEWFHIGCLSMSEPPPPQSEWICDACQARRDKQKSKPGKRKGLNGAGRGRGV